MVRGGKDPSEDDVDCRKLPWPPAWNCLWNTAWFGPHGFLYGNNLDDTETTARKAADCHCYFKWFFEKPVHFEMPEDTKDREKREKETEGTFWEKAPINYIIPGKNLFVHLFFGIMFGWFVAILNSMLHGGDAPWIKLHKRTGSPNSGPQ